MSEKLTTMQKSILLKKWKTYYKKKKAKENKTNSLKTVEKSEIENINLDNLNKKGYIKNKKSIFKRAKSIAYKLFLATIYGSSITLGTNVGYQFTVNRIESNKVDEALEYYGGIKNYLGAGLFGPYKKFVTNDTKHIVIGHDKSVSDEMAVEFQYCYDYINNMFEIINPNYQFEVKNVNNSKDCDIYVSFSNFEKTYPDLNKTVVALTKNRYLKNFFTYYEVDHADIVFNTKYEYNNTLMRITMMHEMMHAILLNLDLTYNKNNKYNHYTVPYSVLSYIDMVHMQINLQYPQGENYKRKDELKNRFVTYTPFDIAAFAARYGDYNDVQNKKDCTKLIINTYNICKEVFDKQDFFIDSTELNQAGYPKKFDDFLSQTKTNNLSQYNIYLDKEENEFIL